MTRSLIRSSALLAALCLAVSPSRAAAQTSLPPLIDANDRLLGNILRTYAFTPSIYTAVGASWDRTVYDREPGATVSGLPCSSFAVLWSECLNNPNAPAISQAEQGVMGAVSGTAGEVLTASVTTSPSNPLRPANGWSEARARTEVGSNAIYAAASGGFERETFFVSYTDFMNGQSGGRTVDEKLWIQGTGISVWSSTFTADFSGQARVNFSAFRHGNDALEALTLGGSSPNGGISDREATLRFGLFDLNDRTYYGSAFSYFNDPSSFDIGPGWLGGRTLDVTGGYGLSSYALDVMLQPGRTYSMVMYFDVSARGNAVADYYGTSKVDYFEVPEGGTLNFGAGTFAVRTFGQDGGGPVTPVPEPSTWALLATGVLVLAARRRRSAAITASRTPTAPPVA